MRGNISHHEIQTTGAHNININVMSLTVQIRQHAQFDLSGVRDY